MSAYFTQTSTQINRALDAERAAQARRNRSGRARFAWIDLGYPRPLFGVWDFSAKDTVRDDGRTVQFTKQKTAASAASRMQREG